MASIEDEDNNDESELDYPVTFEGSCTCEHDEQEHGWESCNVEGCNCEAHWEE